MACTLIDTHCHLTMPELLPGLDRLVAEAAGEGVDELITVACRAAEAELAIELHGRYPAIRVAAGIHPHEAAKVDEVKLLRLAELWHRPGVVAAGEMGLDYHYDFSPRDVQQSVFRRQLELAAPLKLPLVIHSREAQADVVRILTEQGFVGRPVVFHCFSGGPQEAAELRACGWWTSFTGVITFKNAEPVRRALLETPLDQLMFETDSPYLSPQPVRKIRPNQPRLLPYVVRCAAQLRGETFERLAEATTDNARRFYRL